MRRPAVRRAAVGALALALLGAAPLATASATTGRPAAAVSHPHAQMSVSSLRLYGPTTLDVATGAKVVKVRIQVKDWSKKFDPTSVSIVVQTLDGTDVTGSFTVKARRVGRSHVVTNWLATISVPQAAVAKGDSVKYRVVLVKVADNSPLTPNVVKSAKALPGRDTFTVVNTAK